MQEDAIRTATGIRECGEPPEQEMMRLERGHQPVEHLCVALARDARRRLLPVPRTRVAVVDDRAPHGDALELTARHALEDRLRVHLELAVPRA